MRHNECRRDEVSHECKPELEWTSRDHRVCYAKKCQIFWLENNSESDTTLATCSRENGLRLPVFMFS